MDRAERRTRDLIAAHGWGVIAVPDGGEGPFAYSVGLTTTFNHPEIIVFGLDTDTMHRMINNAGEEVRSGQRFFPGDRSSEVLDGCDVAFRAVDHCHFDEYFGHAQRVHGKDDFEAIQMFWPDAEGRFPWDAGFTDELRDRQPVLDAGE
jgi:Domain of unknown function (DUF4262)